MAHSSLSFSQLLCLKNKDSLFILHNKEGHVSVVGDSARLSVKCSPSVRDGFFFFLIGEKDIKAFSQETRTLLNAVGPFSQHRGRHSEYRRQN